MMLQIGVGYGPRTLRTLQAQPAQGLMLIVAADDASVSVSAREMTIEVAAPSAHAGLYTLAVSDLAHGPVCLTPPVIRQASGLLEAKPGLWAYDGSRGPVTVARQWLAGSSALPGATGLAFRPTAQQAGLDIVHAETARQGDVQTSSLSLPFRLPGTTQPEPEPDPEPARLMVSSDATLEVMLATSGMTKIDIVEPQDYAGSYSLSAALLEDGPVWLVPALIEGTAQAGSTLTVRRRGLPVGDSTAGPLSRLGQWHRDGIPIPGATQDGYLLVPADAGRRIGFLETASDRRGSRQQMSNEIAISAQASGGMA